jgi:hypothetical protein
MGNLISASENKVNITEPVYVDPTFANKLIDKQNVIINKLNTTINESNTILTIDASNPTPAPTPTLARTVQGFEGFTNVNDKYLPPISLSLSNEQEIQDYINSYNQSIALLDDPNKVAQANFDAYIHLQDKKLADLQNTINKFPTNPNLKNNPIKSIKNIRTSTGLNVEAYPDENKNNNGAPKYPNYLIYGNNGCLQYNTDKSKGSASWAFEPCNSNNSSQRFYLQKINTLNDYNNKITDISQQSFKIKDTNSTIMGFHVVNPESDSSQCVQINSNGLSVVPCNMDSTQRFKPYYHSINP